MMNALLVFVAAISAQPVTLELPPQDAVPNVSYHAPACLVFPQRYSDGKDLTLLENGRPVQHQLQVRSRWPDNSIKWAHAYARWKYAGGKPLRYDVINRRFGPSSFGPAETRRAPELIPYLVDDLGREFKAGNEKSTTLEDGPVATVFHVQGDMISARDQSDRLMRVQPFLRFEYWATCYANRCDVSFAYVVCSDCRGVRIASMGVRVPKEFGAVCCRNEGSRRPIGIGKDGQIEFWPSGGSPRIPATKDNLHAFPWLHSGQYLDFRAPDDAHELALKLQAESEKPYRRADGTLSPAFTNSGAEWSETRANDLRTSTPEGISICCNFSLVKVQSGETPEGWSKLLDMQPVAKPSAEWICASGALGRIAARSKKYEQHERAIEQAWIGFHTEGDGWANHGNQPERRRADETPFQHRACSYNHYWLHPAWLAAFRGAGSDSLRAARGATQFLGAFGQCRYNVLRSDGLSVTRSKNRWGFYHSLGFYPWATTDYGLNWPDNECELNGHWVDPYALQLSWLHDCNWFHKSGFDGWASTHTPTVFGIGRESNSMLAQYVYAWRYTGDAKYLEGAKRIASILITQPLELQVREGRIGVLWCPTWPLLAEEVLGTPATKQYIIDSAKYLASKGGGMEGLTGVAVIARAVELGADRKLLDSVLPPRPIKEPGNGFRLGPGPLGERHEAIAWPWAVKAMGEN